MQKLQPPIDTPQLSKFWSYTASFGALWGFLEITIGTFIHTLRIPMASVFLVILGTILLIAQRKIFHHPGISLATGLTAALLKSLSPGGIVLSPMIAISMEALLVEIAFLSIPQSFVAGIVAANLTLHYTWVHKLLGQLIFFGQEMLNLYISIARSIGSLIGITHHNSLIFVYSFFGIVAGIAILCSWAGTWIGKRALIIMKQQTQRAKETWSLP